MNPLGNEKKMVITIKASIKEALTISLRLLLSMKPKTFSNSDITDYY
jgi:hypothetical protein